jgi:hypothetical protein
MTRSCAFEFIVINIVPMRHSRPSGLIWYDCGMENGLKIDVSTLDAVHRRALEEVIGRELATNQQLMISVIEAETSTSDTSRPPQSLDDWTRVYDGLNDEQIEAIDGIAKKRANLARNLP